MTEAQLRDSKRDSKNPPNSQVFLMAEDNPTDAKLFSEMLREASNGLCSIVCVENFHDTLRALRSSHFTALILDFNLPGTEGFDNLKQLSKCHPQLPVVVLTGLEDDNIATESFQLGVQDFLSKNHISPELFLQAMKHAMERKAIEVQLKKALEESAFANQELTAIARHDPLTKLPNKSYFIEAAERAIRLAARSNSKVALIYFDINDFKSINDNFGHSIGDQVLVTIALRVKRVLRSEDMLARIAGDAFVVLIENLEDTVFAYPVARHIYQEISETMSFGKRSIHVEPSIGIATYPESNSVDNLLKHADVAMYEAKHRKDHFVHFYTKRHEKRCQRRHNIENELVMNFDNNDFSVKYQPIYDSHAKSIVSLEALCRWHSQELQEVLPEEFIPIAEWSSSIHLIYNFVLNNALSLAQKLASLNIAQKVAINVGARQFVDNQFAERTLEIIDKSKLNASNICLEITERQIISNIKQCRLQLETLKERGVEIALDDYGTGFSSITHLKNLPIDIIKIDRSLISKLDSVKNNLALTAGIIEMAHRMNIKVVGEGVERQEEQHILTDLGCDYLQGFLFAKPMSTDEILNSSHNE